MFFAPPVKVPRTQRLSVTNSDAPPYAYRRATEVSSGLQEAPPTSLEDAVMYDNVNRRIMTVSSFLSGAGTHMCWLVDENKKMLRLWNVSRPGWEAAAPRLAEIPYFAAAKEGLPLFVSEMSEEEESLAFCSERGAISSLDHSIEIQMIDTNTSGMSASCFVCARRRIEEGTVIVTVLGTTSGVLVVDLKYAGTHTTTEFDRRNPSSYRWARGGHNNLDSQQPLGYGSDGVTFPEDDADNTQRLSNEEAQMDPSASTILRTSNSTSGWWQSLKSFVARDSSKHSREEQDGSASQQLSRADSRDGDTHRSVNNHAHADGQRTAIDSPSAASIWPLSAVSRRRRGDSPLTFTHVQLRHHYVEQVLAVNAAGEVFLLDFDPVPPSTPAGVVKSRPRIAIKWATSLPKHLGRAGYVVSCAESRHKICVLYYVSSDTASHPLPALWLVTLDASLGRVVNYVVLNALTDVVRAATRLPFHHIKLFPDDIRREVFVCVGPYVIRVNNQVGVRQPCSSEDTVVFAHLHQPVTSILKEDDTLVTLDANGPQCTVKNVLAARMAVNAAGGRGETWGNGYEDGNSDGEAELRRILDAVRTDAKLSLDSAVLYSSECLSSSTASSALMERWGGESNAASGNWARRNLNAEDENIVLRVTRQLVAQQQAHRRFLLAVLENEQVRTRLSTSTLAQLLSTQEALLSLSALRSMQNIGLNVPHPGGSVEDIVLHRVLPSFKAMVDATPQTLSSYLLQRRPSRPDVVDDDVSHNNGSAEQQATRLMKNAEQMERCQQMMRRAIVAVAGDIRSEEMRATGGVIAKDGGAQKRTAAELCFSHPANLPRLLHYISSYITEVRQTVSMTLEEKFAECYAAGCIFVVVAQTIVESREALRKLYDPPNTVMAHLWTSSSEPVHGLELCFSRACVLLSDALADVCDTISTPATAAPASSVVEGPVMSTTAALAALTLQHKCDMLDVISYLLYFSLSNSAHQDRDFVGSAMMKTLLRQPFLSAPLGYPYGAPTPSRGCMEIGQRILRICETLALRFDAMEILMAFALADPVDDPALAPEGYERLQRYCQQNSLVFDAALQALWRQRREWELLSLPTVLTDCPDARIRRNNFLEAQAPHLLWLAEPSRYEALVAEGQTSPPYIPYGGDEATHRSRCNAVARLAWLACGAPTSSSLHELQLSEAIVAAQQQFFSGNGNTTTLGPQEVVQRLLDISDNVSAWVQATVIASYTVQPTGEDLLVQILRRCRAHDGEECLQQIYNGSVSEREIDDRLRRTALGQALLACAKLQNVETLRRVCETVLSAEEFTLLSSWMAYLWVSGHEKA